MRDEILSKIIERAAMIWKADANKLNEETQFADFSPKSTHYSQMTTYLEDAFDAEIPYLGFKKCKTFGEAVDYVEELLDE